MQRAFDIQVQKLFAIVLVLKVASSGLGWYLQAPWSLGFWLPLALMSVYIVLGLNRRRGGAGDLSDEKFADTCYYLGFIFTITSIIFSLFDLPNIGTHIQDIAVRFGAGMVSTVLGLGVRVYLVSFSRDFGDAARDAEASMLDVARKFREQMVMAYEKLRDFQTEVEAATQASVAQVAQQAERMSTDHAAKLTHFFKDLTERNQQSFSEALDEVINASLRLSESVDRYAQGMQTNIGNIEKRAMAFTDAMGARLNSTTFPDDFFSRQLAPPLEQLQRSAGELAGGFERATLAVGNSSAALDERLLALQHQALSAEGALGMVQQLSAQQQAVLGAAQGQVEALGQLTTTLAGLDQALAGVLQGVQASHAAHTALGAQVAQLVAEGARARQTQVDTLGAVVNRLETQAEATGQVAQSLTAVAAGRDAVTERMSANTTAFERVAARLDAVAAADAEASQVLVLLGRQAGTAISKVDNAVTELQNMVWRLATLDAALRQQGSDRSGIGRPPASGS